jgi:hypothetical protein
LRAKRSNPSQRVKKNGLLPPSLRSYGGQVVARAPRNDGAFHFHSDTDPRSRGTMRPRFVSNSRPRKSEGAGNAGCALHPRSRVQCAQGVRTRAYRAAEAIRHSLRNGFTAYSVLSLVTGFLATIIDGTYRQLDASTGASGPHDFAVRFSAVRQRHIHVHRIPSQRS